MVDKNTTPRGMTSGAVHVITYLVTARYVKEQKFANCLPAICYTACCGLFLFRFNKIFGIDVCLFQNCPERSFRHIPGMIGYCCIFVSILIIPYFMTSCCLSMKFEAKPL